MSTTPTPYKPSPLSFNSPRASPFRRPNSPLTHSPSTARPTTPGSSPLKPSTPSQTPLRSSTIGNDSGKTPPAWLNTRGTTTVAEPPTSPTRTPATEKTPTARPAAAAPIAPAAPTPLAGAFSSPKPQPTRPAAPARTKSSDALSHIPPSLLHSMRESFSVLDRNNSGSVNSADVADMLSQIGLDASPSSLSQFFPNGTQSINLATYLHTISDLLATMSRSSELYAAFEAFDDDDSGQIDLVELKDALVHLAPEPGETRMTEREIDMVVEGFSGRRAFGKGGKGLGRGEVFRYGEFIASVTGGGNNGGNGGAPAVQG